MTRDDLDVWFSMPQTQAVVQCLKEAVERTRERKAVPAAGNNPDSFWGGHIALDEALRNYEQVIQILTDADSFEFRTGMELKDE